MPRRDPPKAPETIEYICGGTIIPLAALVASVADSQDCGAKTAMKTTESIRCKECGHRVMYKPRTHRSKSFLAHVRIYMLTL
jgi:DNA-directed RNA polymerase subunit RPC12/RpoP